MAQSSFSLAKIFSPLGHIAGFEQCGLFFDNIDNFVGSFYCSTCKFDPANDEFNRTRRFETLHNCCHQERFQMFITTPIGATSAHFVVKTDRQNFGSTCGSLRKSFWRHDIKQGVGGKFFLETDDETSQDSSGTHPPPTPSPKRLYFQFWR